MLYRWKGSTFYSNRPAISHDERQITDIFISENHACACVRALSGGRRARLHGIIVLRSLNVEIKFKSLANVNTKNTCIANLRQTVLKT